MRPPLAWWGLVDIGPLDLDEVDESDALVDALRSDAWPTDPDPVAVLLLCWRAEVHADPLPVLVTDDQLDEAARVLAACRMPWTLRGWLPRLVVRAARSAWPRW